MARQVDYLKYELKDEKVLYQWWIDETVPGRMVQYNWKNSEGEELKGELVKILKNE